MIGTEASRPDGVQFCYPCAKVGATLQFDTMALAVVEADCFDGLKAIERPRQTGRAILSPREKNECSLGLTHAAISSPQ
jgi:hypothetical protein